MFSAQSVTSSEVSTLSYTVNEACFHVSFLPNIKLVGTVRKFVGEFYLRVLSDRKMASRLTLATHELVENAIAYADNGETEVRIEAVEEGLKIRTWNRATPEQQAAVEALVDAMNAAEDPDDFYQLLLIRTARQPTGSGLGLARVRAEADMNISLSISDDRICIEAVTAA